MDCGPWAVPSEDQKRMFDALSYDEQLEMVRAALNGRKIKTPLKKNLINTHRTFLIVWF